jgi:hypothetical protein
MTIDQLVKAISQIGVWLGWYQQKKDDPAYDEPEPALPTIPPVKPSQPLPAPVTATQQPQPAQTPSPAPKANPDALRAPWSDPVIAHHNVRALCDLEGITGTQVIDGVAWLKKDILTACVYQESEFRIGARHQNTVIEPDGTRKVTSTDFGIVQVNDYWHIGAGKDFPSADYVLTHPEECVRWMCRQYKAHGNLNAWSSYTTGAFKRRLGKV